MIIKFIIVIMSVLLLIEEKLKITDKFDYLKNNKKKVTWCFIISLLVFSSIDLILEKIESDELTKKANNLIIKSDTLINKTNSIIHGLEENLISVQKSGQNIYRIDSVLNNVKDSVTNQLETLDKVVKKSRELVRLEELKFKQDEANLVVYSNKLKFVESLKDTTQQSLSFVFENIGKRDAIAIKGNYCILSHNNLSSDSFQIISENTISDSVINYGKVITITVNLNFKKSESIQKLNYLAIIFQYTYKDAITKKKKSNKIIYTTPVRIKDLNSKPNFVFVEEKFTKQLYRFLEKRSKLKFY